MLAKQYASHSFVIDKDEAAFLFENVRFTNANEQKIVDELGRQCRDPVSDNIKYLETNKNT